MLHLGHQTPGVNWPQAKRGLAPVSGARQRPPPGDAAGSARPGWQMKITRITVYQVNLPLEHPYWLSGGRLKFEVLDATLVKLDTDAGIVGWGEGTPWGHTYVPAHGPGIRAGLQTIAPFVLGLDPRRVLDVERAMDLALPGHLYAKSPLDMACWDIAGPGRWCADCRSDGWRVTDTKTHCLIRWRKNGRGNTGRHRPLSAARLRRAFRQDRGQCRAGH